MKPKKKKLPLWFGIYCQPYEGGEPAFFDDDFAWRQLLEANAGAIKEAVAPLMTADNNQLQPYFDADIQFPPAHWKSLAFLFWGKHNNNVADHFPALMQILQQVPRLVSASISLLEPQARILPHTGETNGVFRVHLGLSIPGEPPGCGFKVKDETRAWQEGKCLVFLDAFQHEAFNQTDEKRYVLILDIVRPEFQNLTKHICVQSLSVLSLYWLMSKLPAFLCLELQKGVESGRYPAWFINSLLAPFKLGWYVAWPFMKKAGKPC